MSARTKVTTATDAYNWAVFFPTGGKKDQFGSSDTAKRAITGDGVDLADFIAPSR